MHFSKIRPYLKRASAANIDYIGLGSAECLARELANHAR